jgi:hypothetical protein
VRVVWGERCRGKTTLAAGAVRAARVLSEPPVRCVVCELGSGDEEAEAEGAAAAAAAALTGAPVSGGGDDGGDHGQLHTNVTVVAPTRQPSVVQAPVVERYLMAAVAMVVGEAWRDGGDDALVVLDEMGGTFRELWLGAATMAQRHAGLCFENGRQEIIELRPFYSALLQRTAKLKASPTGLGEGGGSLSLLALVASDSAAPAASTGGGAEDPPTVASPTQPIANSRAYALSEFDPDQYGAAALARLGKLADYRVDITDEILLKLGLSPPREGGHPDGEETAAGQPTAARRHHSSRALHIDEMMSLADGHIILDRRMFAAGLRPAINPTTSLTRIRDTRAPALAEVSSA